MPNLHSGHIITSFPSYLPWMVSIMALLLLSRRTGAFLLTRPSSLVESPGSLSLSDRITNSVTNSGRDGMRLIPSRTSELASTTSSSDLATKSSSTTDKLNVSIERLCNDQKLDEALALLKRAEDETPKIPDERSYVLILHALAVSSSAPDASSMTDGDNDGIDNDDEQTQRRRKLIIAEGLLQRARERSKEYPQCTPKAQLYNAVAFVWCKLQPPLPAVKDGRRRRPPVPRDGMNTTETTASTSTAAVSSSWTMVPPEERCLELLRELWTKYEETKDRKYVPLKSTYIATLNALSRSGGGTKAAQQAEELLEEMEQQSQQKGHVHLEPTTLCFNILLNSWSKSGHATAASRCESILDRMEDLCLQHGRLQVQPDTTSFNTVIDALARGRERGRERRAEALLQRMDDLDNTLVKLRSYNGKTDTTKKTGVSSPSGEFVSCKPDLFSFNTVLNCWARSHEKGAAKRATAILRHMERRFASNNTDIHPDTSSYTTVIKAWAGSREKTSISTVEDIVRRLERMHELRHEQGNDSDQSVDTVKPSALVYNAVINCYAKSTLTDASARAINVLERMKDVCQQGGRDDCCPDVITYTSVIDTLAKEGTTDAAARAQTLLEELELEYNQTRNRMLKPNVRTYTSTIQAIGRSGLDPGRATAIVERMEYLFENGDNDVKPDVVTYNALLNAYGWSNDTPNKSTKCVEVYRKMKSLYESGTNLDAKPDIITCNSILNACAFEDTASNPERAAEVMQNVVTIFEEFQSSTPIYGHPNYLTYAHVLLAISRHMPMNSRRNELAEATFWQCCRSGSVSKMVIVHLQKALSWDHFVTIMGPALLSNEGEKLKFELKKLPSEWTENAPKPYSRRKQSSPSAKRQGEGVTRARENAASTAGNKKKQ